MSRMKWNDAHVWLPTLLFPDFVLFPQCRVDVRILDVELRHQLEPYLEGGGVVNVFWAPVVEDKEGGALQVSEIGTISKMVVRGFTPEHTDRAGDPPLRVTLLGLYRIRCEALREIDHRLISRFRILKETIPAEREPWDRLLDDLRTWLHFLALHFDIRLPASVLGLEQVDSPETLVNQLCMELPLEPSIKQELLEVTDVFQRGTRLCQYLQRAVESLQGRDDLPSGPVS